MSMPYSPVLSAAESRAFEAARSRFPGALSQSYMDVASRGLVPADAPQRAFDHHARSKVAPHRVHGHARQTSGRRRHHFGQRRRAPRPLPLR